MNLSQNGAIITNSIPRRRYDNICNGSTVADRRYCLFLNFLRIKPRKAACYADVKSCLHQREDRFVAIPAEMWYSNTQKDRKKDRIVWAKD